MLQLEYKDYFMAELAEAKTRGLASQLENELREYLDGQIDVGERTNYSQAKLVRRIALFEGNTYPDGKFDSQGDYKFWFDIIAPRIDADVKNIDLDSRNIEAYSPRVKDALPSLIVNLKLREYLRKTGQAEELNSAIEEGEGWGNVVWCKTKDGYEREDLRNFYVINQTAFSLNDTPVIKRREFTQSELRAKKGTWDHIDEAIKNCKAELKSSSVEDQAYETTVPYYEIFQRDGEVRLSDLKEHKGKESSEEDREKYVLARVVAIGIKGQNQKGISIKYILFADELGRKKMSDLYKEYHRGRYKGVWFREGLYELLFDSQVRANQIGNQISRGLEWASKAFFTSDDKVIAQNLLTDMTNGDLIIGRNLRQIEVRMQGLDQLIADWNRVLQQANDIANSREVVQGINPPSGTPLGTTNLLNINANKLFDFLREKLAIPLSEIFEQWIIPELVKELKAEEILRLTGDSELLERFMRLAVDDWYVHNLIAIGPHAPEAAQVLKEKKFEELRLRSQLFMENIKELWEGYKPHVSVDIVGESLKTAEDLVALADFIKLETDPVRRTALIEMAMKRKGFDVGALPKSPPTPEVPSNSVGSASALIGAT